jgi:hypothetical protein
MSLRFPPLDVLATFPTPNYTNPVTHGPELTILNLIFLGIATSALVLRLYSRVIVNKWLGLDDWLICISYVCLLLFEF